MAHAVRDAQVEFRPRTDPITFEVLRHRLWQINDEQGRTIINVSGSPVASEVNDFNIALTDAEGNLVMLGPYLIHHTGAISVVVRNAIAMLGDDIGEGDIYLTNDPWMGALHHNDVCCVAPVHHEGRLVAWTACTVHQIDVGGPVPGSWYLRATDTFQEAPRYRFLRIVRGGDMEPAAIETYLTNSRTPSLLELDLRAMIASSNVVKERLAEAWERYGVDAVTDTMQDCMDYSELMLRQRLESIPDGSWYAEDYLDHDGHDERVYAIRLALAKRGTSLRFDYTATDEQAPGFINCTFAGCLAGTLSPVLTQLCAGIPWNEGVLRCVDIATREGILNNASFPAPVGMGTISACHHTSNASMTVVGKMLSCHPSDADPMANWSGSPFVYNVFGSNQYGQPFGTMLVDSHLGAAGARSFADGYSTSGTISVPRASVPNVESVESLYPLLYLYRERTPDSGGAGMYRGGVSAASAIVLYGVDELNVTVSTIASQHSCAVGLGGGYPGAGVNTILVRGSEAIRQLAERRLARDPHSWGGDHDLLPSKESLVLRRDDVLVTMPHGGGGFRDPLLRDPEAVRRDVVDGYVSREHALAVYGVALEAGAVDTEATERRRRELRVERLEGRAPRAERLAAVVFEGWDRLGEAVRHRAGVFACAHCGNELDADGGNPKIGASRRILDVGHAGPLIAMRWNGVSPNFQVHEYACPSCGYLIDVQMRRRGDEEIWADYQLNLTSTEEHTS